MPARRANAAPTQAPAQRAQGATEPALRQRVYADLRAAIERGSLPPGARLPPSREHARVLGVSRNTVLWAVQRLQAEGYLEARVGDGTYVPLALAGVRSSAVAAPLPARGLSQRGARLAAMAAQWQPPAVAARPFRIGAPEVAQFPWAVWDRIARQASRAQRVARAQYLDPAGDAQLRSAIAQWLWASRGIRCDAQQVVVCAGSQQAIDLIARLLLDPGDAVVVEDPGYPGVRLALQAHGAQVCPVPLDGDGLCVDTAARQWPQARMAVVTPTHQFPSGAAMGLARRRALLDWAQAHDAWVVEDDYDGEFQWGAQRLPALCSLPGAQRVLHVGTFSKTLHPGLRLGYVVVPAALAEGFAMGRALSDRHAPGDAQAVLARFIADGHLLRHLRRMRELYAERQWALRCALARATGGVVHLEGSERGMQLLLEAAPGTDDAALSRHAQACGVMLAPLSRYAVASPRRGWLFGFAGYDAALLDDAAQRIGPALARAWARAHPGRVGRAG
ncbi:PLP-dependent aminotransferase family protein [Acidovorax lacteus]|uniref:PLP-dependent aminotransferase family protein n=1 Tax=Acidovorax lacteus TaxID=1924988 RepID=A0ABP8LI65_9BURK